MKIFLLKLKQKKKKFFSIIFRYFCCFGYRKFCNRILDLFVFNEYQNFGTNFSQTDLSVVCGPKLVDFRANSDFYFHFCYFYVPCVSSRESVIYLKLTMIRKKNFQISKPKDVVRCS